MIDGRADREDSRELDRIPSGVRTATRRWWPAAIAVVVLLLSVPMGNPVPVGHGTPASPGPAADHPSPVGVDLLARAHASLALGQGPAEVAVPRPAGSHPAASLPTNGVSMTYDAADHYVLALGPNDTYPNQINGSYWGNFGDTWTFSGGSWTKLSLFANPSNRAEASMAYDAKDGCVILFGGYTLAPTGYSGNLNDTWKFVNGSWTNLTQNVTNAPPPRSYASMVWDASDQYVLLYGGFGLGGNNSGNLTDSWSFTGLTWTSHGSIVHPPFGGAMGYDSHDGYVLEFGGTYLQHYVTTLINETWKYHAGLWQNLTSVVGPAPSGRAWAMLSDDPNLGGALLFGGSGGSGWTFTNDSWLFVNQTWTLLSLAAGPSPRTEARMVFDTADNATILFGGRNSTTTFSDTWAFGPGGNASVGWTQAAPILRASQARVDAGSSVTFSAEAFFGTGAAQFNYSGLPPGCMSADTAVLPCVPTMAGNYTIRMTGVLAGGTSYAYTMLQVNPALQIVTFGSSISMTELNHAVQLTATVNGGTPWFRFAYTGLPAACPTANSSSIPCTPDVPGNYSVVLALSDSLGGLAVRSVNFSVAALPAARSLSIGPTSIDLTQTAEISLDLSGGVGPFVYTYPTVPTGCTNQDAARLLCRPNVVGAFPIVAGVTDAFGAEASASGTLTVNPWPTVTSFSSSAETITLGETVSFHTQTGGGTGSLAYTYTGLPAGCADADVSALSCVPSAAGTYAVTVGIRDAVGGSATSVVLTLHVAATAPGGGAHPGSGPLQSLFTTSFAIGLLLGVLVLAAAAGVLVRGARERAEGRRIVEELGRRGGSRMAPNESDATPPGDRPPPS